MGEGQEGEPWTLQMLTLLLPPCPSPSSEFRSKIKRQGAMTTTMGAGTQAAFIFLEESCPLAGLPHPNQELSNHLLTLGVQVLCQQRSL